MAIDSTPDPLLRVTVGSPIFSRDDQKIGKVEEIRGLRLKVDGGLWRHFWLDAKAVAEAVPDLSVTLGVDKANLDGFKVKEPPRAA
jgi:hypothetical protein